MSTHPILDPATVEELRRLARSRPRSGRQSVAKAGCDQDAGAAGQGAPPPADAADARGWYPHEHGDPFYELDGCSYMSTPEILRRHWETAWREGGPNRRTDLRRGRRHVLRRYRVSFGSIAGSVGQALSLLPRGSGARRELNARPSRSPTPTYLSSDWRDERKGHATAGSRYVVPSGLSGVRPTICPSLPSTHSSAALM